MMPDRADVSLDAGPGSRAGVVIVKRRRSPEQRADWWLRPGDEK